MTPLDIFKGVKLVSEGPAFDTLGLVHRVRIPEKTPPSGRCPTLVMVHGHQGNEDVTWVFAHAANPSWLIVSPRAPFAAESGTGYSWNHFTDGGRTESASFRESLLRLTHFVDHLAEVYPVDPNRIVLLGFSQGAAMSYSYLASHLSSAHEPPTELPRLLGIAALSGYVPGLITLPPLQGFPIFMFHGTKDETITIERAYKDRDKLINAGANLTFREDPIGHKLSAAGMRELSAWLENRASAQP